MGEFDTLLTGTWDGIQSFFGINEKMTPGMTADQQKAATTASTFQNTSMLLTVMGGINSAIGSYFAAESARYQDRSQALTLDYQADIASINARSSEYAAQSKLEAGKSQIANMTMAAGQAKASATATMAAHGIRLGVGSAADISASQDIVKDINMYTIDADATRAAAADRTQSTNFQNQALMDHTSAENMRRSADSISPFSAVTSSLLTSASSVASQWNTNRQNKMMFAYYNGGS